MAKTIRTIIVCLTAIFLARQGIEVAKFLTNHEAPTPYLLK